jgi:signal peptidase I
MENEISNLPGISARKAGRSYASWLRRSMGYAISYLCLAILTYGFFQFSHRYLVQTVQVDGTSMAPTLHNAQCYFLNRVVYLIREPKPQDIVVLRDPETNGCAIKRIVARPGDCVYVKGGQLFVNGEPLSEPYLAPGTKTYASEHYRAQMWICGVDQYFVLGDNRNNSADSRMYGAVRRANILGIVTP